MPVAEAHRRLRALPGVGRVDGGRGGPAGPRDADAVSFGDYHVAKDIGWALTGTPVDDDGLAELLEPYAGHRYRVQRLLELAGHRRPRRGPRMAPRTHPHPPIEEQPGAPSAAGGQASAALLHIGAAIAELTLGARVVSSGVPGMSAR